ncbi:MAG TPA: hypothetical protein VGL41_00240, partial [Roseiarcus sp.]
MGFASMRLIGSRRVGATLFILWLSGVGGAVAQSNLPPGSIPLDSVDSGDPAALVVRIDRLEDELRRANGQIEELQNQNLRLQEQFKRFREDVEFRLSGAKPSGGAAAPPPVALSEPAPVVKPRKGDAFDPALEPNAPGAPRVIGSTAPSAPLGAPLEIERPSPLGAAPKPADPPPTIVTSGLDFADRPKEQFNAA